MIEYIRGEGSDKEICNELKWNILTVMFKRMIFVANIVHGEFFGHVEKSLDMETFLIWRIFICGDILEFTHFLCGKIWNIKKGQIWLWGLKMVQMIQDNFRFSLTIQNNPRWSKIKASEMLVAPRISEYFLKFWNLKIWKF